MRLLSTTILLAAGTVLAKHKNGENRGDDAAVSPSSGLSPADQSGTTLLVGGSKARCFLTTPGPAPGAELIVVANSTQNRVEFQCVWEGSSGTPSLNYVALRRYASPTPSVVAAFGTATTAMSSASPVATGPPPVMGGATATNNFGGSNTGNANINSGGSRAAAVETGPTMPPVVRKDPFDFEFQDVEFERRQTGGSPSMMVTLVRGTLNQYTVQILNAPSIVSRTEAVYLELQWSSQVIGAAGTGSSTTTTFTPAFGIVETEAQKAELSAAIPGTIGSSFANPQFPDQEGSLSGASAPMPTGSSTDTKSGDGSGNIGGDGTPSAPTATPETASASSGGLSTGAIAGIAVAAAVVGLAIISLLVWMFLRRRRRANDHVSTARPFGRDQHTATADLMGEKEAAAGGNMESPHSPYSDDGHGSLPRGMAATGAAAGVGAAAGAGAVHSHHASPTPASVDPHRSSFTPYNDDDTAVPSIHADEGRATGARSETPGGRYEHLMEQGMSAEDRARVEEEERQLDAEIERAKK